MLDEHDALDAVTVNVLKVACDADFDIHAGDGHEVTIEYCAGIYMCSDNW